MRTTLVLVVLGALSAAQDWGRTRWGRGRYRPEAANAVFATGDGCALCHSTSPRATALRTATGDDASPHALWQATMMANAFRDPYWRAQVAKEMTVTPEAQALCLRCHAPMAHHTARLQGRELSSTAAAARDPFARDGVSCTVCHQVQPDNLGKETSFSGRLDIRTGRVIFGPFPDPAGMPMRMHTEYTPRQGNHIRTADLCGSCHTLFTKHHADAEPFPEQTPFLEWRNSVFAGTTTCQECHMPAIGPMRIARNPAGFDFLIDPRPDPRGHSFVGGNALLLELLRENATELGVRAPASVLEKAEHAARRLLGTEAANVTISDLRREQGRFRFDVTVENLAGHKLPTGYPARRAWLRVQVRAGRRVLFESGAYDPRGRILGPADERRVPHLDTLRSENEVVIYEARAVDSEGRPTAYLTRMVGYGKDNRLLPRGWRADGPHAEATKPHGVGDDPDFKPGRDVVHCDLRLPKDAPEDGLRVVAWLLYQPIPPGWADSLRAIDAPEARAFLKLYDAADPTPEKLAVAARFEGR